MDSVKVLFPSSSYPPETVHCPLMFAFNLNIFFLNYICRLFSTRQFQYHRRRLVSPCTKPLLFISSHQHQGSWPPHRTIYRFFGISGQLIIIFSCPGILFGSPRRRMGRLHFKEWPITSNHRYVIWSSNQSNEHTVDDLPSQPAFDPPFPSFEGPTARRRLNKNDALFVDVIHTNARSNRNKAVGFEIPLGHADFYPNGGSVQPGCEISIGIHRSNRLD